MAGIFQGKHVVVTGGTGALGSAVVRQLVDAGASVHVPVFNARELERFSMCDEVELMEGVDLTEESSAARFYSSVPRLWASVHLAGGFAMAPLAETSAGEFVRMMRLNALSCFLSCQAAYRRIRETEEGGRIVNIAARPAIVPTPGMAAYAASKAAVLALTMSLSEELAQDRIWVNAVVPSIMDTAANRREMPDADTSAWPTTPEVARTICFLASPDNQVSRGAVVPVYGRA